MKIGLYQFIFKMMSYVNIIIKVANKKILGIKKIGQSRYLKFTKFNMLLNIISCILACVGMFPLLEKRTIHFIQRFLVSSIYLVSFKLF